MPEWSKLRPRLDVHGVMAALDGASGHPTDFPAGWREAPLEGRSHDSHTYDRRFMLRLDAPSERTLQPLVTQCGVSKAQIIRRLNAHATPEDFPKSWRRKTAEHALPPMRQQREPRELTHDPSRSNACFLVATLSPRPHRFPAQGHDPMTTPPSCIDPDPAAAHHADRGGDRRNARSAASSPIRSMTPSCCA